MHRERYGYSIRARSGQGTALAFLIILVFPMGVAMVVFGPAGVVQFIGTAFDFVLERTGTARLIAGPGVAPAQVQGASNGSGSGGSALAGAIRLPAPDWDIRDGHFFTQTNGQPALSSPTGFVVSDAGGVGFWDAYRRYGGPTGLGYPLSGRFNWRGFTVQIFQRGVLQDLPDRQVGLISVMDELSASGKDVWLQEHRFMPRPLPADYGAPGDQQAARLRLLGTSAQIAAKYESTPHALTILGLPTTPATDMGQYVITIRTQRSALHYWKVAGPWGAAGDVTIANAGEIALELDLFPGAPTTPEPVPPS